jgi:hypothetical protein
VAELDLETSPVELFEYDLEIDVSDVNAYTLDAAYHAFIAQLPTPDELQRDLEASLEP